ncbi:PAS domain-containing sensor histidine kinase [Flavobacterium salilacus subsp. salilacus]|uniref:sensor histidine kinase n=1 Tax=Flavobacterium TaxID=237 RepID=UPI001074EB3E|nr:MULTISPECIES: PAS domain-containing sensor histidine kinase [Flavobacterium]KAF2518513.1 PAS domain-containing sensor histidine kinase [Flavobacterium salilacus subsp. salilacus]MBE1615155.1 PAS domain-containing sensor histidine kinase [Flavobacterium sp. SaA2.13]
MKFFDMPDIHDGESLNAFYKKLLDQVPDLIFKMICKTDNLYSIVFASETVNDILELSVETFMSNTQVFLKERLVAEDFGHFKETLEVSKKTFAGWNDEFRVRLPIKGLRWMRINAKPELQKDGTISFYARVSDITEQKEHERRLKISEERFKYALHAASEGIWDWDMITDNVYFSGQSMSILGVKEEEAVVPLKYWRDRMHPDDMKQHEVSRNAHLKGETAGFENIYRIINEEGKYRWVLSRGKVVAYDDCGKPTRAIGTHKDITLLKEKEIELGNTIDIIGDQNNRLTNFAHIVSHNLRSHAGNLKMLIDIFKGAKEDEKEEMLNHLEAISDSLYVTIIHLKELVDIQFEIKTVKENLNLRYYLKNILNILHNEITKHGVNIEINIPLDVTVNYNPAYLESVLLNFTTNAIKYSSSERKPMLSYDFEVIDGKKVLSISDNGLGIDLKKHKNSLFGMYKTFHKNQNSRGIGLFITKNQVEAMGGKIEVFSEVNKGTTFKIYFNENG